MPLNLTTRTLALDTGTIRYVDEGQGPPVLLLHGAPMTSLGFVRMIRTLRQHHRVLAPDLPGFGGSVPAPDFAGDLDAYSAAIRAFVGALDLTDLTVYLNDSSACLGLVALAEQPEHRQRLTGLVIADTVPLPIAAPIRWILRVLSTPAARWVNRRLGLLPWITITLAPLMRPFPPQERRALLADWGPGQYDRVLDLFEGMATDDAFMARAAQAAQTLSDVPALVLYGALDPMRLAGGPARWSSLFDRSEQVIIPWEEHFPILARGEQVGRLVAQWHRGHR